MDYLGPGPSDAIIEQCVKIWGLRDVQFVRRVENFVYRALQGNSKEVYLRLTAQGHRTYNEICAEISWLQLLLGNGVRVVTPLSTPSGFIHEFYENERTFYGVLFEAAPGRSLNIENELTPSAVGAIGRLLASLHQLEVPESISSGRRSFKEEYFWKNVQKKLDKSDGAPFVLHGELSRWMSGLSTDHFQLVHADLHHGNLFFRENELVPIDFDDSCIHWKTYDIAIPLIHILMDWELRGGKSGTVDWVKSALLEAYAKHASFPQHWENEIENFMSWRVVILFHLFKDGWKNEVEERPPSVKEWIIKAQEWWGSYLSARRLL